MVISLFDSYYVKLMVSAAQKYQVKGSFLTYMG